MHVDRARQVSVEESTAGMLVDTFTGLSVGGPRVHDFAWGCGIHGNSGVCTYILRVRGG
jgi:hypothetical protein